MKTPAEFEPLGLWIGWHLSAREGHATREWTQGYWWTDGNCWIAAKEDKTSLTDAEAVEALNRLVEKGYSYGVLGGPGLGHSAAVFTADARIQLAGTMHQPTIPAAVEEALLRLIDAEGGKE